MKKIFYKKYLKYKLKYLEIQNRQLIIILKYRIQNKTLKVYVSTLLRTWETAVLLYLPFLVDNTSLSTYRPILILVISPFLKEIIETDQRDNLQENINQFFNFIVLLNKIIKKHINLSTTPSEIGISEAVKKYPQKFTIVLVIGDDQIYLYVDIDKEIIEYSLPQGIIVQPTIINTIDYTDDHVAYFKQLYTKITKDSPKMFLPSTCRNYDTMQKLESIPIQMPQMPYSTISMTNTNFNSFDNIKNNKHSHDIFAFLKWVIEIKSHPKNVPIHFVSHLKPMKKCLKELINIFTNYNEDYDKSNIPNNNFIQVYNTTIKTNNWSMRFKYFDYNVIGFRHAFSCGNLLKKLKFSTTDIKRYSHKSHTTLSLWGILSTIVFITKNIDQILIFDNDSINNFSIMNGMPQQEIIDIDTTNELTCDNII
jgi:hypothetical protein